MNQSIYLSTVYPRRGWSLFVSSLCYYLTTLHANLIAQQSVSSTLYRIWTTFCSTHDD